jgi:HPt (histidine-containing phosphotransfer) domain-containing protein
MMTSEPLDLAELHRQTAGDAQLTREVLQLFVVGIRADLASLMAAAGYDRQVFAHRMVGSARAVGAVELARLAASVEVGHEADVTALASEVAAAVRFVETCLAGQIAPSPPQAGGGP